MAGVTTTPTKMTTRQVEVAAMGHFNYRQNLIVPNVSWGAGLHECDLLVVRLASLYGVEVEIKVSAADLKKDKDKRHGHRHHKLRELWFAMPSALEPHLDHVPERAGILLFDWHEYTYDDYNKRTKTWERVTDGHFQPRVVRKAQVNTGAVKFTDSEVEKIKHLGCMRIHTLLRKTEVVELHNKELRAEIKKLKKELIKLQPPEKETP